MGEGIAESRGRSRSVALLLSGAGLRSLWLLAAASACALDFSVERDFECPPQVSNCSVCNADGSCRVALVPAQPEPGSSPPAAEPLPTADAAVASEQPPSPPLEPPPPLGSTDAGASPPDRDSGAPPAICAEYASRTSDSLCLDGDQQCFSLGSVLSPALAVWLDPTSLPRDGSRIWCDRSGQGHHALLLPQPSALVIEPDGRAVGGALGRSLLLDGTSLGMLGGTAPVLGAGNFAVLLAAAGLPAEQPADAGLASAEQPFELFESGEQSRINLTLVPGSGKLEGKITSLETALVTAPVVTQSSVYDGAFHLYSLHRRSEVRVLDDVLQLRLNGVLEFRGSSIAIPRALDLSSGPPPRLGSRTSAAGRITSGRGRLAAAILFRGAVPEDELARLENFLCANLAVCGAPLAAQPSLPQPSLTQPSLSPER